MCIIDTRNGSLMQHYRIETVLTICALFHLYVFVLDRVIIIKYHLLPYLLWAQMCLFIIYKGKKKKDIPLTLFKFNLFSCTVSPHIFLSTIAHENLHSLNDDSQQIIKELSILFTV